MSDLRNVSLNGSIAFEFFVQKSLIDTAETDAKAGETGLVEADFTVRFYNAGDSAFANLADSDHVITEIGNGWYRYTSSATAITDTAGMGVIEVTYDPGVLGDGYEGGVVWVERYIVGPIDANLTHWRSNQPNNITFGRVDASVGAMASGVLTATAIASDAITAAKIADNAIDAGSIASNAITAAKIASDAITSAKIADNAITAAKLASDAITAAKIADGAIDRATFAQDALDLFGELRRNTATAGAATTITLDASASAVDDFYNGALIMIVSGTGAGQFRTISDYVGATKVATVPTWSTNPDATSVFVIIAATRPTLSLGTDAITADVIADDAAAEIAAAVGARVVEGSHTADDLQRLAISVLAGPVTDFTTNTLVFKSLDGSKTRLTITKDATGRVSVVVGDLT